MSAPYNDRRRSVETQASALDPSILSFSGFSHQFPAVPDSIPNSPVSGVFPRSPVAPASGPSRLRETQDIGPYDWAEGASTIDSVGVDAAEHSLLSTSFITGLLRENADPSTTPRRSHRVSVASDFSEMTYPPPRTHSTRAPPPQRPQGQRPQGSSRPPPSAFQPIPESSSATGMVSDDDTLYSNLDDPGGRARGTARGGNVDPERDMKVASSAPSYGKEGYEPAYTPSTPSPYSPALPSSGTQQRFLPQTTPPETRMSMHSNRSRRSVVPSFISASSRSIVKAFTWRKKPLPPIPKIPHIPVAHEAEFKQKEESTPLSQLLMRSDALRSALDNGQHPHASFVTRSPMSMSKTPMLLPDDDRLAYSPTPYSGPMTGRPALSYSFYHDHQSSPSPQAKPTNASLLIKKRRLWIIMLIFLAVVIGAVGAAIGVTLHNRNAKSVSSCSGNSAGAACDLDATCVCTSPVSNRCDGLAQNLVTLTPTMNTLFETNYTTNDVYLWIWAVQGTVKATNCAAQAVLVDVGATSALTNFPNRTEWAQSALLWDLQSLNNTGLRDFVLNAPWNLLTVDGPVTDGDISRFSTTASGYSFNFAAQTLAVPPVSFSSNDGLSDDQAGRVSNTAPLDRMYSFAAASSSQHQGLLNAFWVTNLQRRADKLETFLSIVRSSPIMIPFNAGSSAVRSVFTSTSFPVPISCYPDLTAAQLEQINTVESVFGLDAVSAPPSKFDSECFPSRPVYGILDILRLRIPFADSRQNISRQAVTLNADVGPPRGGVQRGGAHTYGTLSNLNHVVLEYLSGMPTLVANAVVDFVLSNSTTPPGANSLLATTTVPLLEVALFGTISSADIDFVSSALTNAAGALVFGAANGDALRNWAVPTTGDLVWTEFSNSSLIVHDDFKSSTFNQTWAAAQQALGTAGVIVGVSNITGSFSATGLFTSS
ncbi:hypothetical protein MKEN_00830000 [Mycena kentingensis (nom. inval.)]|nr:hypothetical protein MKEN_00830000 [Mycena kentingensis (nom. inval.)]